MSVVCNDCGCKRELSEKVVILPNCPLCGSANRVREAAAVEPADEVPSTGETVGGTRVAVERDDEVTEEVAATSYEDEDESDGNA